MADILEALAEYSSENADSWENAEEKAERYLSDAQDDEKKRNHYAWYEYQRTGYTNGILY